MQLLAQRARDKELAESIPPDARLTLKPLPSLVPQSVAPSRSFVEETQNRGQNYMHSTNQQYWDDYNKTLELGEKRNKR